MVLEEGLAKKGARVGAIHTLHVSLSFVDDERVAAVRLLLFLLLLLFLTLCSIFDCFMCVGYDSYL